MDVAIEALRGVSLSLPHLSGLATAIRVAADTRVPLAGVFASGLIVVHPEHFPALQRHEAVYVMAHELMHLALRHHARDDGRDRQMANIVQDYIINDMLTESLEMEPPVGGLYLRGASVHSTEALMADLLARRAAGHTYRFRIAGQSDTGVGPGSALGDALIRAGLAHQGSDPLGADDDVLPDALEGQWFPSGRVAERAALTEQIQRVAAQALSLGRLQIAVEGAGRLRGPDISGGRQVLAGALGRLYQPPWEAALQHWLEGSVPTQRSYARPSRRAAHAADMALPGRTRNGWTLNIVLDTSGSMHRDIERALTAIAGFCDALLIERVRMLQCDTEVTEDREYHVADLHHFTVHGLGGSNMSPAMQRLADDPEVTSAIVITDGHIGYPQQPMPYRVLWALTSDYGLPFSPPYGQVVRVGSAHGCASFVRSLLRQRSVGD